MAISAEMLKKLLTEVHNFIPKIEKENIETTIVLMCLNWILITVGTGIAQNKFTHSPAILALGIIFQLTLSFFLTIAFSTLGGKGKFKNVLDALTYPYFGLSLSILIVSILVRVVPLISALVSLILFIVYTIVGLAGTIRILKDSFKLDVITVWIVINIVILALFVSIYLAAILHYSTTLKLLPSLF